MTAREDAIAAIARALHSDNCPDDVDWAEPCGCADWDREARIAYEAADPIIRADERAKAHVHNTGTSSPDACCECCYDVHSLERDHLAARRRVKELLDERKHLRAQVKALRHEEECDVSRGRERPETGMAECNCLRADVLDLLGGESE